MLELHAIFRGRVQGLGFRAAAQRKAEELHLTGYIQNLPDGSVELVAQGPQELLKALVHYLHSRFDIGEVWENYISVAESYEAFNIL